MNSDVIASSRAGPSPYADVLRKREEHSDPPTGLPVHDLNWLLGMYGPYYVSEDITDTEIFQTLDGFGLAIWQVESPSERGFARGVWMDWLKVNMVGVSEPWRLVDDVMKAGRRRHEAEKLSSSNGVPHWLSLSDLATLEPPPSLIGGLLPLNAFGILVGAEGSGKTFLLLDAGLSVATGTSFHGEPVAQGGVAYILGEGRGGVAQRIVAWAETHGLPDDTPFKLLPVPVHLTAPETVEAVITSIREWCATPKLVIVDTLFRCFSGNEHSPEDMNKFIGGVDQIRQELGTAALVAHHPGHNDKTRGRGHSSLAQAVDVVMRLERSADTGLCTLNCEKARDNAPFARKHFRLTRRGPSLVPELAQPELTPSAESTLAVLHSIAARDGASHRAWKEAAKMAASTFNEAIKTLTQIGYVSKEGDRYRVSEGGLDVLGVA